MLLPTPVIEDGHSKDVAVARREDGIVGLGRVHGAMQHHKPSASAIDAAHIEGT
jgi:hypothetical protein